MMGFCIAANIQSPPLEQKRKTKRRRRASDGFALDDGNRAWGNAAMSFGKDGILSWFGILAVTLLQPVASPAVTMRDDRSESDYLNLALQTEYAAVGELTSNGPYSGSGTLIAPDWVLTGAHNLVLASSVTFTINGNSYVSTDFIRHPNYQLANSFAGYDFGLVHLSSPVPGVTPAVLYNGSEELSQMAVFVGYGFGGTGATGVQFISARKRAFQNVVDGNFGNPAVLLASDFDNPHSTADNAFGTPDPANLEGSVAFGDSGGGVFLTIGQQTYLAGVISFVAATDGNANSDYGDVNGFGRVSALNPWITSIVPEPSSATLLTGAGLAWLTGRGIRRLSSRKNQL